MTTHRQASTRPAGALSQAGLILSLVGTLDNPRSPLGRRAMALAARLSDDRASRSDIDAASVILAQLLDETDAGMAIDDENLLDAEFDS